LTEAKHKPPAVHAGAKRLVEVLLATPDIALADAAKEAGLTTRSARTYLGRPNVIRYLREEKAAMLEAARVGNIPALVKVRSDGSNQMAVVAAVRQLETMGQTVADERGGSQRFSPGLVIQIVNVAGEVTQTIAPPLPAPLIDVTPEREALEPEAR
jgi:hypothetical protein